MRFPFVFGFGAGVTPCPLSPTGMGLVFWRRGISSPLWFMLVLVLAGSISPSLSQLGTFAPPGLSMSVVSSVLSRSTFLIERLTAQPRSLPLPLPPTAQHIRPLPLPLPLLFSNSSQSLKRLGFLFLLQFRVMDVCTTHKGFQKASIRFRRCSICRSLGKECGKTLRSVALRTSTGVLNEEGGEVVVVERGRHGHSA